MFRPLFSLGSGERRHRQKGWRRLHSQRRVIDPDRRLKDIFLRLSADNNREWMKEVFPSVRILVIGRTGTGKTTLIRLVVGKDGPQGITEGKAGVQDINTEYLYYGSERSFSLVIHDSNGVDIEGKKRADEIRDFLRKRNKESPDFSQHVHLIWYLISSVDTRCLDDADIMRVVSEADIPMLLIMSFDDWVKEKPQGARIVTDAMVDKLLERVRNKDTVKKNMVRVGNPGVKILEAGNLLIDESNINAEALRLVSQRTQELMAANLRSSWASLQVVCMRSKLDASGSLIAKFERTALLPSMVPLADAFALSIIFFKLLYCLCEIWRVPQDLMKAIKETHLNKECLGEYMVHSVLKNALLVGVIGAAATASVLSGGAATIPSVVAVIATSGILNAKTVPILMKTFALQVVVCILYTKCTQRRVMIKHEWDPDVQEAEYLQHCETIAHNSHYDKIIKEFAKHHSSDIVSTAIRYKKEKSLIVNKIVDLFSELHLHRDSSLYSHFESGCDQETDSASSSSTFISDVQTAADLLDHLQQLGDSVNSSADEDIGTDNVYQNLLG